LPARGPLSSNSPKAVTATLEYADYRAGNVLSSASVRTRDSAKIQVKPLLEY